MTCVLGASRLFAAPSGYHGLSDMAFTPGHAALTACKPWSHSADQNIDHCGSHSHNLCGSTIVRPIIKPACALRAVVYLDADALVMRSLEGLFSCPGFCAVTRHAEHFNTGVLVLTPSAQLYAQLLAAAPAMASYTG